MLCTVLGFQVRWKYSYICVLKYWEESVKLETYYQVPWNAKTDPRVSRKLEMQTESQAHYGPAESEPTDQRGSK